MGDWERWKLVAELLTAASFSAAFGFGWVALEGLTENAAQDARDEQSVAPDCAPTVRRKAGRA